jgi:hypothetical protein
LAVPVCMKIFSLGYLAHACTVSIVTFN